MCAINESEASITLGGLRREIGNISKASMLSKGEINEFIAHGFIIDLLQMNEEMETSRKYKIGYQVLMYITRYKVAMKLGDLKRKIGNISKTTGISKEELNEFMMELLRDILRLELEDDTLRDELRI